MTNSQGADTLLRATTRGTAWNFVAFSSSKLAAFSATMVLARLLVPADFGLLALGLLVLRFLGRLSSFGIDSALIQRNAAKGQDDEASDVAFYLSLGLGVGMTVVTALASPMISQFFKEPNAVWVIRALSLSFTIGALRTVPEAQLRKRLDFRRRAFPQILGAVCKGATSVVLALFGFGVWSLVAGQLLGEIVQMVAYWRAARWWPGWTLDSKLLRPMMTFGGKLLALGLLVEFLNNLDYIVIGRTMTSSALGHYTIAYRLPELVILSVCYIVSQAAFPAYARVQKDKSRLSDGFLTSIRWVSFLTFPAGAGMFVVASDLVHTFYGAQWQASILPMQLLAVYTVLFSIPFNAGDIYKATDRIGLLVALELIRLAMLVPAMAYGARYGIDGVAAANLAVMGFHCTVTTVVACKVLGVSLRQFTGALRTPMVASSTMAAAAFGVHRVMQGQAHMPRLFTVIAVGAMVYTLVALAIDRTIVEEIKKF